MTGFMFLVGGVGMRLESKRLVEASKGTTIFNGLSQR